MTGDGLTHQGATRLAAQIQAFWQKKGEKISSWIEPLSVPRGDFESARNDIVYVVRSNLIAGKPI